jgi:hypothetical protein
MKLHSHEPILMSELVLVTAPIYCRAMESGLTSAVRITTVMARIYRHREIVGGRDYSQSLFRKYRCLYL